MMPPLLEKLSVKAVDWLTRDAPQPRSELCAFDRLSYELRPGDVILIEGRSRVAEVIKLITQSTWSHSALYIGRSFDIPDPILRKQAEDSGFSEEDGPLIVEALLGKGTILSPLEKYRDYHMRICRPEGLAPEDAKKIIQYVFQRLGNDYDVRQILDLARFFFPWGLLPKRWRSTLFEHNAGSPTRTVCTTLLAEAFQWVDFPILPFIEHDKDGSLRFYKRNPRLFTPKDFDHSPYFHIIKYHFIGINELALYHHLPWQKHVIMHDEDSLRADEINGLTDEAGVL